ncbi:hypothetical protein OIU85_026580 [Salix viminalis]|uniref:Uncharacterized protein n=1 Tax=Salix viminalis TaxID=40686 RepID=A0A9Q0YYT6_SALVM|nr:hypothetical protein OIU85_026580 [Salix viminalis]
MLIYLYLRFSSFISLPEEQPAFQEWKYYQVLFTAEGISSDALAVRLFTHRTCSAAVPAVAHRTESIKIPGNGVLTGLAGLALSSCSDNSVRSLKDVDPFAAK